eukprot:jgi/Orpsp1_1/1177722/evm.model.c7180000062578.2
MKFNNENKNNYFQIIFDHCTFIDIKNLLFNFCHSCVDVERSTLPQTIFNDCKFKNVNKIFSLYHRNKLNNIVQSFNCYYVIFKNCHFESIQSIGDVGSGNVDFDKCTFNNIYGEEDSKFTFIYSVAYGNNINLMNSDIKDSIVKYNRPFFYLSNTSLKIYNTTFTNCQSSYGYLIYMKTDYRIPVQLIIDDSGFKNISTLIDGYTNNIIIDNSYFHNIGSLTNGIMKSHSSEILISNSEFKSIHSFCELFNSDSNYKFTNNAFLNIYSSTKNLFNIVNHSVTFDNCIFRDIFGTNDKDSSIIKYSSNNYENSLNIINSIFNDCKSNNDFIVIDGEITTINIVNSIFNKITLSGSVVNNISQNSLININNSNVTECENLSKQHHGIISLNNNDNVSAIIHNSIFRKNMCKNNGGSL